MIWNSSRPTSPNDDRQQHNGTASDSDPDINQLEQGNNNRGAAPDKFQVTEANDFFMSGVVVDEQPTSWND